MDNFTIAHLYPDLMNLYGDQGNVRCLQKRLEWYGYSCTIRDIHLEENIPFQNIDLLFMGGGSDREQGLVFRDLLRQTDQLVAAIERGLPVLCICGAYQLLGSHYQATDGKVLQGLGIIPIHTQGEKGRLIGNIAIESEIDEQKISVVGFENHGGRTYFDDSQLQPFGTVIKGFGNNGRDKTEGVKFKNLIGTYLHGPLLPKNPLIADFFIKAMVNARGLELEKNLDDAIENLAHEQVKKKILSAK